MANSGVRARFRIGELSALAGVSVDTVRYYERAGVLAQSPRTEAGYRVYGERDLGRLRFIRRAKLLGLSLREIRGVLTTAEQGDCGPLREEVLALLEEQIAHCERQLAEVRALRESLIAQYRRMSGTGCDCAAFPDACGCLPVEQGKLQPKGGEADG